MSADNGIYILKTLRNAIEEPSGVWTAWFRGVTNYVYRVACVSAIDNLDYYIQFQPHNAGAYMVDVWGKSPVYTTEEDALAAARSHPLSDQTEYGIVHIDMSQYVFYGDL